MLYRISKKFTGSKTNVEFLESDFGFHLRMNSLWGFLAATFQK